MPRGTHNNHAKSERQHRWSDKKMIATNGYVRLRVGQGHPLADPNGYAYEHLIVWVAAGKLRPQPSQVLHHRNSVRTDNRIENLELLERGAHARHHNAERGRDMYGRFQKRASQMP